MKQITRAGSFNYKGHEVPSLDNIFINKSGHECQLRGTRIENNKRIDLIYIFELDKFTEIEREKTLIYLK